MERETQFIGQSVAFQDAVERASQAATLDRPVLVIGERGTGTVSYTHLDWNVQRRRDFAGRQDLAAVSGVDAQGRYIFTNATGTTTFNDDNQINVSSSVWRLKVGVSYDF